MSKAKEVRVWDIWVRLFHWSLAVSVIFMLLSGNTGWLFIDWHRTVGEWVMVLIVFRIVWGIVGSSNARLSELVHSPRASLGHLTALIKRRLHSERGHNAAGSWAVVIMLLVLAVQAGTGFFIADEDELIEGALYGSLSGSTTELLYRIHKINAELIQIVVVVHIVMVLVYLFYGRQNLISPMINGSMKWVSDRAAPQVFFQAAWVGLVVLALAAAIIGYFAGWYT